MAKKLKDIYQHLDRQWFWVTIITSIVLLVVSFILPPTGVIHPSVLQAVGELFAFGALGTVISAIHKGKDITVSHGNTNLSIGDKDQSDLN